MPDADLEETEVSDEQRQVDMWRKRQALQAGLTPLEARIWAESEADVGTLRRLVKDGCPVRLIREIVI